MSSAWARRWPALKGVATVLLLVLLFRRLDLRAIAAAMASLSLPSWLINLSLFLGASLIATAKWKVLLPEQRGETLLRLNFVAQFYSLLLPGQVAGEAVKAYRLGKGRIDAERIAASVGIDRVTGFLGLLLVAIVGVSLSSITFRSRILFSLVVAVLLLVLSLFLPYLPVWSRMLAALERRAGRFSGHAGQLRRMLNALKGFAARPGIIVFSIVLGSLFQLINVWINYRVGSELGIHLAFADWCWIFGMVSLVAAIPLTIAGLGLREGSFVAILGWLNISSEKAITVSLVVFSLFLVGAAIGAVSDWLPSTGARRSKGREAV